LPPNDPAKPRKVSASKYTGNAAAKVKFRIKGQPDGPVYQGQSVIAPCRSCGGGSKR